MAKMGTRRSDVRRARATQLRPDWVPSAADAKREIRRTREIRYRIHRQNVLMFIAALSVALGYLIFSYGFVLVRVEGAGMSPTLDGGGVVLCVKQDTLDQLAGIVPEDLRRIGRNDLVLVKYLIEPDGVTHKKVRSTLLIKRVIGLGGDEIDTAGDVVIVNREETAGQMATTDLIYPVVVPTGQMYLMGDNRTLSVDSRHRAFGMMAEADVIARPVAVVWPVFAVGLVK